MDIIKYRDQGGFACIQNKKTKTKQVSYISNLLQKLHIIQNWFEEGITPPKNQLYEMTKIWLFKMTIGVSIHQKLSCFVLSMHQSQRPQALCLLSLTHSSPSTKMLKLSPMKHGHGRTSVVAVSGMGTRGMSLEFYYYFCKGHARDHACPRSEFRDLP